MRVGVVLRNARIAAGLTIEELARAVHVAPCTLSRYETGAIREVPADVLAALARILDEPAVAAARCRECPVSECRKQSVA